MSAPLFNDSDSVGFELHRLASLTLSPLVDQLPDHDLEHDQLSSIRTLVAEAASVLHLAADIATGTATPLSEQATRALYLIASEIEDQSRDENSSDATHIDAAAALSLIESAGHRASPEA
jgi:hypothetical protein